MSTRKPPTHWSPHQAYAALNILEELHQMIWDAYENELVEIIVLEQQLERYHQATAPYSYECGCDDFDHDIPF